MIYKNLCAFYVRKKQCNGVYSQYNTRKVENFNQKLMHNKQWYPPVQTKLEYNASRNVSV